MSERRMTPPDTAPIEKARPISVLVVDDHALVREGLIAILDAESDLEMIGAVADAEAAIDLISRVAPDIVVADFRLPGMDAAGLCRLIAEQRLPTSVVVLSAFLDEDAVHASLMAGARAYIVKDVDAGELKRAIRAAARGEMAVDAKITGRIIGWAAKAELPNPAQLRPSEIHVLQLLSRGSTTAQIAASAGLRPATVKSYLSDIYVKLGAKTRAEAVATAFRLGLLRSPVDPT